MRYDQIEAALERLRKYKATAEKQTNHKRYSVQQQAKGRVKAYETAIHYLNRLAHGR